MLLPKVLLLSSPQSTVRDANPASGDMKERTVAVSSPTGLHASASIGANMMLLSFCSSRSCWEEAEAPPTMQSRDKAAAIRRGEGREYIITSEKDDETALDGETSY